VKVSDSVFSTDEHDLGGVNVAAAEGRNSAYRHSLNYSEIYGACGTNNSEYWSGYDNILELKKTMKAVLLRDSLDTSSQRNSVKNTKQPDYNGDHSKVFDTEQHVFGDVRKELTTTAHGVDVDGINREFSTTVRRSQTDTGPSNDSGFCSVSDDRFLLQDSSIAAEQGSEETIGTLKRIKSPQKNKAKQLSLETVATTVLARSVKSKEEHLDEANVLDNVVNRHEMRSRTECPDLNIPCATNLNDPCRTEHQNTSSVANDPLITESLNIGDNYVEDKKNPSVSCPPTVDLKHDVHNIMSVVTQTTVHVEVKSKSKKSIAAKDKPPQGKPAKEPKVEKVKKDTKCATTQSKSEKSEKKLEQGSSKVSFFKSLIRRSRSPSPSKGSSKRSESPVIAKGSDVARRLSEPLKTSFRQPTVDIGVKCNVLVNQQQFSTEDARLSKTSSASSCETTSDNSGPKTPDSVVSLNIVAVDSKSFPQDVSSVEISDFVHSSSTAVPSKPVRTSLDVKLTNKFINTKKACNEQVSKNETSNELSNSRSVFHNENRSSADCQEEVTICKVSSNEKRGEVHRLQDLVAVESRTMECPWRVNLKDINFKPNMDNFKGEKLFTKDTVTTSVVVISGFEPTLSHSTCTTRQSVDASLKSVISPIYDCVYEATSSSNDESSSKTCGNKQLTCSGISKTMENRIGGTPMGKLQSVEEWNKIEIDMDAFEELLASEAYSAGEEIMWTTASHPRKTSLHRDRDPQQMNVLEALRNKHLLTVSAAEYHLDELMKEKEKSEDLSGGSMRSTKPNKSVKFKDDLIDDSNSNENLSNIKKELVKTATYSLEEKIRKELSWHDANKTTSAIKPLSSFDNKSLSQTKMIDGCCRPSDVISDHLKLIKSASLPTYNKPSDAECNVLDNCEGTSRLDALLESESCADIRASIEDGGREDLRALYEGIRAQRILEEESAKCEKQRSDEIIRLWEQYECDGGGQTVGRNTRGDSGVVNSVKEQTKSNNGHVRRRNGSFDGNVSTSSIRDVLRQDAAINKSYLGQSLEQPITSDNYLVQEIEYPIIKDNKTQMNSNIFDHHISAVAKFEIVYKPPTRSCSSSSLSAYRERNDVTSSGANHEMNSYRTPFGTLERQQVEIIFK